MVNAQAGLLMFLLTCEIRLNLSKFFCYSKHKNCITIKAIIHFRNRQKKSSQIYKLLAGFTEGNGERLLLKY